MKIKKATIIFLFCIMSFFFSAIRLNADTLLTVYLESQESTSVDSIRYISTMENATDLDEITNIRMEIQIEKDGETKTAEKTTTTVFSSVSGTNGKEEKENTYYSVLTITDVKSFKGWKLSVYFIYDLSDNSTVMTNTISYDIPDTFNITYHMNGGSFSDSLGTEVSSFSINNYNEGYWDYYKTSVFLYDNATENTLGAKYALRIGINLVSGNTYEVSHIYASGASDYKTFTDEYAIVVHYDNADVYSLMQKIEVGNLITLSFLPSSSGAVSVTAKAYDTSIITKEYDKGSEDTSSLDKITTFTISHFDVTNSQYNNLASSEVMLNDKTTENALGALYSYRVSMNSYGTDTYLVEKIYASGTSDYNKNDYDYTIVVHSDYSAGYALVKKISVGDIVEIKSIPTSTGACSLTASVYDKDDYDSLVNVLEIPVRSGYVFDGWYLNEDLSGDAVMEASDDITLYAKWEQAIYDAYTTRQSNTDYIYGNDVSHYQGTINFTKYKANSNFMIAKVGQGTSVDEMFTTYVTNAIANDVPMGLYYYSMATSVDEAKEEATWVVTKLASLGYDKGTFTYPLFMDYEDKSIGISGMTKAQNTAIINAFAQTLLDAGYYPGLYIGGANWKSYVNQSDVICDVWVAAYSNSSTISAGVASAISSYASSTKVTMIQFDDGSYNSASLSGATLGASSTNIDQDVCFVDYPTIIKSRHFNGF